MGRRTWDSLPDRFRPLPGRRNIVVTRNPDWQARGRRAGRLARRRRSGSPAPTERVFVIGGAEIYAAALPLADELLLTEIDAGRRRRHVLPAVRPGRRSSRWRASRTSPATGRRSRSSPTRRGRRERVLVGTSGWGYPSWQPGFYPAGLDRGEFLSFYADAAPDRRAERDEVPAALGGAVPLVGGAGSRRLPVRGQGAGSASSAGSTTSRSGCACLGDRLGCVRVVVERPRDDGFLELLLGSADPAHPLRPRPARPDAGTASRSGSPRPGRCGWTTARAAPAGRTSATASCCYTRRGAGADRGRARALVAGVGIETYAFFRHGDEPDAPAAALRCGLADGVGYGP